MSIKSFGEFIKELKNKKFEPLPPNAIGSDGEFENWLHSLNNPTVKWAKRCANRDKLYKKLKRLGRIKRNKSMSKFK